MKVSGTRKLLCVLELEEKIHSSIFSLGFVVSSADSMVSFLWDSDSEYIRFKATRQSVRLPVRPLARSFVSRVG